MKNLTDKNTPFQAVRNKGWKFVTSNESNVYKMYGFPTQLQFQQYIGDYESLLIPIHYDMCVGKELIQSFFDATDQFPNRFNEEQFMPGEQQPVADCFHDPITDAPAEFILFRPIVKTIREFLAFHK